MRRLAGGLAVTLALSGCGAPETQAELAPSAPMPPFRHDAFYEVVREDARHFSFAGGDWLEDYGDAAFYGLGFYARTAPATGDALEAQRAAEAHARAAALVDDADLLQGDVNEFAMAALGLVESIAATGDRTDIDRLDSFVDRLGALIELVGWYLPVSEDSTWSLATYGPTSISALVGLIEAQYALLLGGDRAADRLAFAEEMERQISDRAWNGTSFDFGAGREGLFLYPNVAMMLLESRLYQLTGEEGYRQRALDLYRAIQPLRLPGDDVHYRSPYSAGAMGAKTEDYSTLSSQSYLVLALVTLGEITGDTTYVEEADSALDWMESHLVGTWCLHDRHPEDCAPACTDAAVCVGGACTPDACHGGVLHHWMDGRPALPSDPELFCSGCNLQILYAMWHRRTRR